MTEAYPKRLRDLALGIDPGLKQGVYAALLGPSYETPAEIRYLRAIGADLVGMSTVSESIAANHMGMSVLGISTMTNAAAGLSEAKLGHEEVLAAGRAVAGRLTSLLTRLVSELG
jgi:purine-nucleoside phosphorylase